MFQERTQRAFKSMASRSTVGMTEGAEMCMPAPVVCVVGNPMKMRPPGFLLGRTEANTSAILEAWFDEASAEATVSSYDEVKMDILVVFGGGFFVARSSSVAKDDETRVVIWAEVTRRKMTDVDIAVRSSDIASWIAFSSFTTLARDPEWAEPDVSLEKKFFSEGSSEVYEDSLDLVADAVACGFQPITLIKAASICVLMRSAVASFMIPSLVRVSKSRGMSTLALGDDFF
jgi:hypothetical protein